MDSQSKHIFFVFVLFLLNISVRFVHVYILFTYFGVRWVFVAARGLSVVAVSRGYSLVGVHGLLTAEASLVGAHRL